MALYRDELACAIARNQFKPIVGEVVRILLTNPGIAVSRITQYSAQFFEKSFYKKKTSSNKTLYNGLVSDVERRKLVRDALTVLVQHGIAYPCDSPIYGRSEDTRDDDLPANGRKTRQRCLYYINVEVLLYRPRIPLYLAFVKQGYGEVGVAIFRAIFERGRLTSHYIFKSAILPCLDRLQVNVAEAETCLCNMAQNGLLHWHGKRDYSPICRVIIDKERDGEANIGEPGIGKKRIRPVDMVNEDLDEDYEPIANGGGNADTMSVGRGGHARMVGMPRQDNDTDVWGICYWHLNRQFRNQCCVLALRGRTGNDIAVRIMRLGLQLALRDEDCELPSDNNETDEVSTEAIRKLLDHEKEDVGIQQFWDAIKLLAEQSPTFVRALPEDSPTFLKFIPGCLVSASRQKTLEDLVLHRYGTSGHRVFRSLLIEGGMEDKMIAEKCLFPLSVAREQLSKMYNDRVIIAQEVPRSHEKERQANWYYLWTVNPMAAFRNMLGVMYKTITNMYLRLECIDIENAPPEKKGALEKQEMQLIASIHRMDQSVMVMRDFGPATSTFLPTRYEVIDGQIGKLKKRR